MKLLEQILEIETHYIRTDIRKLVEPIKSNKSSNDIECYFYVTYLIFVRFGQLDISFFNMCASTFHVSFDTI